MQIRHVLATAAVAAVTAPVALFSVSPAHADAAPSSSTTETTAASSMARLEKAARDAQQAYDAAVAHKRQLIGLLSDPPADLPAKVARDKAKKAADDAAAAKRTADARAAEVEKTVGAILDDPASTDDERVAGLRTLHTARTEAATAGAAKDAADAALKKAASAFADWEVDISRQVGAAQKAIDKALTEKRAADKALAAAKAGQDDPAKGGDDGKSDHDPVCDASSKLTATVPGLPGSVTAGSTVDFTLRLTNGTGRALDELRAFVAVRATDTSRTEDVSGKLHLRAKRGGAWQPVRAAEYAGSFKNVKPGTHVDLPLRLTVDASAPAGEGVSFVAGDSYGRDGSCGGSEGLAAYSFRILPSGATAPSGAAKPVAPADKPVPQGATSATPVASGTLADTGSSSALPRIGLSGGAAVALGAGAVYVVRRRRSTEDVTRP
ncbi:ML domain-containing protein [Streptomyces beihaiensis]|uniref:Peptidase n=1 Tax=Streptomyces beihaiensis TaxID=2984495 RepID=A0ABT3TNM6_9ACTN|nr:peptidase [Streptomyces beihaiensis]MCX3058644.1 peptidase [Streptomyces beihaiensis]